MKLPPRFTAPRPYTSRGIHRSVLPAIQPGQWVMLLRRPAVLAGPCATGPWPARLRTLIPVAATGHVPRRARSRRVIVPACRQSKALSVYTVITGLVVGGRQGSGSVLWNVRASVSPLRAFIRVCPTQAGPKTTRGSPAVGDERPRCTYSCSRVSGTCRAASLFSASRI